MIYISDLIKNIKTDLEALTWTSRDGSGTTQFQAVYAFPYPESPTGSPFAYIVEQGDSNMSVVQSQDENQTSFSVSIFVCVRYPQVDSATPSSQREEAMLRIYEAGDALRNHLSKYSTFESWLSADETAYSGTLMAQSRQDITITTGIEPELNLAYKSFKINFIDVINPT